MEEEEREEGDGVQETTLCFALQLMTYLWAINILRGLCIYIYMNDSIYNDTRGIVLKRSKGVGLTVENVSPAGYLCLPRSLSLSLSVCWVNMPLLDVCTCHNFAESPAVLIQLIFFRFCLCSSYAYILISGFSAKRISLCVSAVYLSDCLSVCLIPFVRFSTALLRISRELRFKITCLGILLGNHGVIYALMLRNICRNASI